MTTLQDNLAGLPLALACLFVGAVVVGPLRYRAGFNAGKRENADVARILGGAQTSEHEHNVTQTRGRYRGVHRIGDESVKGATGQQATIAALRSPTEEFAAIVATSYRSGELPLIGRPGTPYLVAHMAAAAVPS